MGYSLSIGEAKEIQHPADLDNDSSAYVETEVMIINDPAAPAFGDPTDYTNERWPSYTGWWDFCTFAGILDIMFENDSIIGGHPGYFVITKKFKKAIDDALDKFMNNYPDAESRYNTERPQDYHLCRLLWLKYWTDWALLNCKKPIFKNS